MALSGPGDKTPGSAPRSRIRGRVSGSADKAGMERTKRTARTGKRTVFTASSGRKSTEPGRPHSAFDEPQQAVCQQGEERGGNGSRKDHRGVGELQTNNDRLAEASGADEGGE